MLRRAAQSLPILRRPREIRGQLPEPDELVRVRYECPVKDCGKVKEAWMEYRMSRVLFDAGLVRHLTKGTAVRTRPGEAFSVQMTQCDLKQSS